MEVLFRNTSIMCFIAVAFSCDIVKFIFIRFFYRIKLLLYNFFSLLHAFIHSFMKNMWFTLTGMLCGCRGLGLSCPEWLRCPCGTQLTHLDELIPAACWPHGLGTHTLLSHLHRAGHTRGYMSMMLQQTMQKNFTLLVCIHIIKSDE